MTFSRVAKLFALLLVAAALWRARPADAPSRVAVLVLPGGAADSLAGLGGEAGAAFVDPVGVSSGCAFWRRFFTIDDDRGREPSSLSPVWAAASASIRAFAVPSCLAGDGGSVAATAFAGSSGGAVVEYDDLAAGRLPAPYDRAIEAVTAAAATLGRDQWSDWIRVTPAPAAPNAPPPSPADFQFARLGDSAYLFSPAYVLSDEDATCDPFLRGAEREQRPLLAAHVLDRARRRNARLAEILGSARKDETLVVFDELAEEASGVFAPDPLPAAVRDGVNDSVRSTLAVLRGVVGEGGLVFVVGGPSTARASSQAWFRIVPGGDSTPAVEDGTSPRTDLVAARTLLRHFLGVSLDPSEKPLLPSALVARYPVKASISRSVVASAGGASSMPWTAANLESLPGAVASAD